MSTTKTEATETDRKVVTAQGWVKQAHHNIVLPSGAVVTIRIPDITALIETGEIPQHLLKEAIRTAKSEAPEDEFTVEQAAKEREFKDLVVLATVVAPKLTQEMLDPRSGIPTEDKDMIVAFAMRSAEFDAEGNQLAGLDSSEKFRRFRGITSLYADVEGVPSSE